MPWIVILFSQLKVLVLPSKVLATGYPIAVNQYILFFFFNDTATTEIYTLSLHDALPISRRSLPGTCQRKARLPRRSSSPGSRSEEHTSELQSRQYLVCRLLLEKKKMIYLVTQMQTKAMNEGWACLVRENLVLTEYGFVRY